MKRATIDLQSLVRASHNATELVAPKCYRSNLIHLSNLIQVERRSCIVSNLMHLYCELNAPVRHIKRAMFET